MNAQPQRYFHTRKQQTKRNSLTSIPYQQQKITRNQRVTQLRSSKENYVRPSLGTLTNIIFVCVVATQCSDFRTNVRITQGQRDYWPLITIRKQKKHYSHTTNSCFYSWNTHKASSSAFVCTLFKHHHRRLFYSVHRKKNNAHTLLIIVIHCPTAAQQHYVGIQYCGARTQSEQNIKTKRILLPTSWHDGPSTLYKLNPKMKTWQLVWGKLSGRRSTITESEQTQIRVRNGRTKTVLYGFLCIRECSR